ncbi:ABC-type polysaccharide/polyol phosphate export systems [Paramagnetospirillum magneticum AMB-1]|uniref:Transport permease protein n=1 Tax=Paramagnetospirillum magneticum (strain ATCC 700264 / AMB-1) TaxID=342108 RepID=Q2W8F8_PARM1|nr:ABC-type polysaccharide/polyol phosphate export systems [Paramagnetospirillum magneticum AMB-1]
MESRPALIFIGLVWARAKADFGSRYAGSALGTLWNALQPILTIAVFSAVFETILRVRLPKGDLPFGYTLYLCAGYFPWLAFSESMTLGAGAFLRNAQFIRKMPVPAYLFVADVVLTSFIFLAVNFAIFLLLSIFAGNPVSLTWALIPIIFLVLWVYTYCLGLIVGLVNTYFRDVGLAVPIILQLWMWMTPIVYPIEAVPESFQKLLMINPLTPVLAMLRDATLNGRMPARHDLTLTALWTIVLIALATLAWRRLGRDVRDLL